MKKVIIIVLVLLLASCASADEQLSGCWSIWFPNSVTFGSGNWGMFIQLNEDGTMALLLTSYTSEEHAIKADVLTGTWEATDGGVTVISEDNPNGFQFDYEDGLLWVEVGKMKCGLRKIPDISLDQIKYTGD